MKAKKTSILLFDQDRGKADHLEGTLSTAGFGVTFTDNIRQCMTLLKTQEFQALMVDLLMTKSTDHNLVTWARETFPGLRIIVMSEFESSFLERQVKRKGADAFVTRPVCVCRIQELLSSAPTASSFSGTVNGVALIDYMEFMMWSQKQMVLEVTDSGGANALIYLNNGDVLHAVCDSLEGVEAFYECLGFRSGKVANLPWQTPDKTSINKPWRFLLMEASRRNDEASDGC